MCQDMPTLLYTRWEFDTDKQKFKARNNQSRNFENMVMSFNQETRQESKFESFFTSGKLKKKLTVLVLMVTAITVKQYLKQWDATTTSVPVKKLVPPQQNKILSEETRRERWMICDGNTEKRKDTRLKKCGSVSGGKIYKTNERSKIMSEPIFLRKDLFVQTPF